MRDDGLTSALLHKQGQTNYNTATAHEIVVVKTPDINSKSAKNTDGKKISDLEEAIQKKFTSMFEEMELDINDPLNIDLNESEWLKCGCCKISLTLATVVAALIGLGAGIVISLNTNLSDNWYKVMVLPGEIWIRALKLLVLPLISMLMVILPSRVEEVGSIGKRCIPLYLFTSICAAINGSLLGWTIRPGDNGGAIQDTDTTEIEKIGELDAILDVAYGAIPENIVVAMADLSIVGIIVFFLFLGILLKDVQNDEKIIVLKFCRAILKCTMKAIIWVIWFTPIGMLSLILAQIAYTDDLPGLMTSLGIFIVAIIIGDFIHVFMFYPLLYSICTRNSLCIPWKYLTQIYEAPLLAFATASSAATLPRTLMCAKRAGVSNEVYQFIIPLGAAINMDGTAVSYPIQIALIAQLYNIDLSIGVIAIIALLSVVVSVGAAPIPNAGFVYFLMLIHTAGLEEYETQAIATLFVVEWFNDRIQTAVNVTSDLFAAKLLDDVNIKANKQNKAIYCGCCYGGTTKKKSFVHVEEQEMAFSQKREMMH